MTYFLIGVLTMAVFSCLLVLLKSWTKVAQDFPVPTDPAIARLNARQAKCLRLGRWKNAPVITWRNL